MSDDAYGRWKAEKLDPVEARFGTRRARFETSSGIEVGPVQYTADAQLSDKLDFQGHSCYTGSPANNVPVEILDDAPICWFRDGDRVKQALSIPSRTRHNWLERCIRFTHSNGYG